MLMDRRRFLVAAATLAGTAVIPHRLFPQEQVSMKLILLGTAGGCAGNCAGAAEEDQGSVGGTKSGSGHHGVSSLAGRKHQQGCPHL